MRYGFPLCLLLLIFAPPAKAAAMPALKPHRAFYDVSLYHARAGTPIIGASGTSSSEISESCEGWASQDKMDVTLATQTGQMVRLDNNFIGFERKDGSEYIFQQRDKTSPAKAVKGAASRHSDGSFIASFSQPQKRQFKLAGDTLYPIQFMQRLLEQSQKPERLFHANVFDGSEVGGAVLYSAVLGKANQSIVDSAWRQPVQIAYFGAEPARRGDDKPQYEITMNINYGGMMQHYIVDYKDFVLEFTLNRSEDLPIPVCP
ncbi:MAG: DUF1849 family protein [Dongiaceae bacterium]